MKTIEEFKAAFTKALLEDPPPLEAGNVLSDSSFGFWLTRHFTAEDIEVLNEYENTHGDEAGDRIVYDCFREAGLPKPAKED